MRRVLFGIFPRLEKKIEQLIFDALRDLPESEWMRQKNLFDALCESGGIKLEQYEVFEEVLSRLVSLEEVLEREVWGETAETEVKLPSSEDGKLRLVA